MPRDELLTAIRDAFHFGTDQDRVELTLAFIRELADAADTLPLAINHRLYDDKQPIQPWQIQEAIQILEHLEANL